LSVKTIVITELWHVPALTEHALLFTDATFADISDLDRWTAGEAQLVCNPITIVIDAVTLFVLGKSAITP